MKDKRYKTAHNLISGGFVKSFRDIFEIVPKTTVARDLGMNNMRFSRIITHVQDFFLSDIFRMAALLEITDPEMINLIYAQYKADNARDQ